MIRKHLAALLIFAAFGHAFAAVDVNTANEDALRGIKGIGPARAKSILDERGAHGPFKDAADLGKRVKGMGGHTVERLQAEGLSVGPASGQGNAQAGAQASKTAPGTSSGQAATVTVKK
ncbi:ComEA family DNA-binding protein [Paraburkholderia ferrariae]|jgi:competence protein ComEA|uniref:ComEA family DNA-binding protein n=1 Tax=Paraburkholderia ferrariae TaxID=386056 RepID=UPI0004823C8A|nr:helix-hairpin-helix domain-containing protein [Paraburkholderia ferrariae]